MQDEKLLALMQQAGEKRALSDIRAMLRGIAAAPVDLGNPDLWMELFPAHEGYRAELKSEIARLRLTMAPNPFSSERLTRLRAHMRDLGVDGFFVPRADEFQGEYVPARAERLAFITGFTGSAGWAVVTEDKAAFFTDSRYTLQSLDQVDKNCFEVYSISPDQGPVPTLTPSQWIEKNFGKGKTFGIHAWLHTYDERLKIETAVEKAGGKLALLESNPLDLAWGDDQPPAPVSPAVPHPLEYAGVASQQKRAEIARVLKDSGCDAAALTLPEDVCWLLNIRGGDVPNTPVTLCYGILYADARADLFIDTRKLTAETVQWLGDSVRVQDIGYFADAIEELGRTGARVWVDPASAPVAVGNLVAQAGGAVLAQRSPVQLPKAKKNETEIKGAIAAHIRDGATLTRFLAELAEQGAPARFDEVSAGDRITALRAENEKFRGISFDPIAGIAGNGAIVHYRATEKTSLPLTSGAVFLLDSGGQYQDGTTDVTRTIALDTPTAEMKDRFTRVLKGHIAVARAVFPEGTTGDKIDLLARAPLREIGLDYGHGTGHGVGSYLSVHEGPCGISPRADKVPLEPGMILSNEPGYYKTGEYGIRIENLVLVVDTGQRNGEGKRLFGFRSLTLAPIDRNLIDPSLLGAEEKAWLNDYHAEVREKLLPILEKKDARAAAFLKQATAPL